MRAETSNNKIKLPLRFYPVGLERTYGFMLTTQKEKKKPNTLRFEAKVNCPRIINHISYLYIIDRKQVYINDKIPHTTADEFAEQCGKVIYPLHLLISQAGAVRGIANHCEIAERWKQKKEYLLKRYQGDLIEWYIRETEKGIGNKEALLRNLQQDWFLSLYFGYRYNNHYPALNRSVSLRLPIIPNTRPVLFEGEEHISEDYTPYNTIFIEQKGTPADTRSATDIANRSEIPVSAVMGYESKKTDGKFHISYDLSKENKLIENIVADCSVTLPYDQSRKVQAELHHLKEKDTPAEKKKVKNNPTKKSNFSLFDFMEKGRSVKPRLFTGND